MVQGWRNFLCAVDCGFLLWGALWLPGRVFAFLRTGSYWPAAGLMTELWTTVWYRYLSGGYLVIPFKLTFGWVIERNWWSWVLVTLKQNLRFFNILAANLLVQILKHLYYHALDLKLLFLYFRANSNVFYLPKIIYFRMACWYYNLILQGFLSLNFVLSVSPINYLNNFLKSK